MFEAYAIFRPLKQMHHMRAIWEENCGNKNNKI